MKIKMAFSRKNGLRSLFMSVKAEEQTVEQSNGTETEVEVEVEETTTPQQQQTEPKPSGNVNFEDLIAKARAEEKAKLYPQIEQLKEKNNNALLIIADRDKEIAKLKKDLAKSTSENAKIKTEVEEGTKTNKTVQELTLTISQLENDYETLQSEFETYKHTAEISKVREREIAKANGEIIPELVTGNTEEEILASIEASKQRYAEIQKQAMANVQMPSVNPASSQMKVFAEKSIEEIASMSPKDYAEYRKNLGLK